MLRGCGSIEYAPLRNSTNRAAGVAQQQPHGPFAAEGSRDFKGAATRCLLDNYNSYDICLSCRVVQAQGVHFRPNPRLPPAPVKSAMHVCPRVAKGLSATCRLTRELVAVASILVRTMVSVIAVEGAYSLDKPSEVMYPTRPQR